MSSSLLVKATRTCTSATLRSSARAVGTASAARSAAAVSVLASRARQASTQAALAEDAEGDAPSMLPEDVTSQPPRASAKAAPKDSEVAVGSQFPKFSTLEGKVTDESLRAITGRPLKGLTNMSAVQAAVLPRLPELAEPYSPGQTQARDLLVKARTGTGKTLGFLIPAVESRLRAIEDAKEAALKDAGVVSDKALANRAARIFTRTEVGTLIISPTRELATQIANEAIKLTHYHEGFEVRLLVGGMSRGMQLRDWNKGRRDIVVATPGRLRDLLESEKEVADGLAKCRQLILDEADTLLDMGFRDDIDAITQALKPSPERQTFMFSATVSRSVQQVARATLAKNHEFINCVSEDDSPVHDHVTQYHTVVPKADQQLPHVLRLLAHDQLTNPAKSKVIVFLPTTRMVQLFTTFMRELADDVLPSGRNSNIYEIHSKRTQEARTNTSDRFRNDKSGSAVLVTSDVSARGVDYPGVTRVIQVGIPQSTEQYIHRVGRTGRGGATGGRGDLVLLPWEVGFVTWQLTDVPLKPLTTESLREQVTTLAEKFDKDPQAFFAGTPASAAPRFDKRGRHNNDAPAIFKAPFMPKLLEQEAAVRDLLTQADEEAIKETMASMLGYYISKSPELRVQKSVIVEGLRQWTVEACGLPTPPYVSDTFLARLGMSDNRTKHFGRGPSRDYNKTARRDGEPSWMRRGNQGKPMRRDDGERPEYSRPARLEEGDPRSAPEEYRTPRFNRDGPRSFSSDRGPSRRDNDDRGSRDFGGRSRDFSDRGSSRRNDY